MLYLYYSIQKYHDETFQHPMLALPLLGVYFHRLVFIDEWKNPVFHNISIDTFKWVRSGRNIQNLMLVSTKITIPHYKIFDKVYWHYFC